MLNQHSIIDGVRAWFEQLAASMGFSALELFSYCALCISLLLLLVALRTARSIPFKNAKSLYRQLVISMSEIRKLLDSTTALDRLTAQKLERALSRVADIGETIRDAQKRGKLQNRDALVEVIPMTEATSSENVCELESDSLEDNVIDGAGDDSVIKGSVSTFVRGGLSKSRKHFLQALHGIFSGEIFGSGKSSLNAKLLDKLEELLISCDFGVSVTKRLINFVNEWGRDHDIITEEVLLTLLSQRVASELDDKDSGEIIPQRVMGGPKVILVVGVNGVGKTTTIGKLGYLFTKSGAKVMFAACDTFRAAAGEQLEQWAERAGAQIVNPSSTQKPSAVAYEAIQRAKRELVDVLLVDTAGRLHTRKDLMRELESVVNIISRELPGAPHEVLLVLDGSTGQNALQQAKEFNESALLTGLIVTKLDGTSKGGIVLAIKSELGVPVRYIGVGESRDDLQPFSAESFAESLFVSDLNANAHSKPSAKAQERRAKRGLIRGTEYPMSKN